MVRLSGLLGELSAVTEQVRTGPGVAHAVLYDGDLSKSAAGTLDEVHKDLVAIREGNGVAHALVYGDDQTQHVMGNLSQMSDDSAVDRRRTCEQARGRWAPSSSTRASTRT
jgi:hypothetical protein